MAICATITVIIRGDQQHKKYNKKDNRRVYLVISVGTQQIQYTLYKNMAIKNHTVPKKYNDQNLKMPPCFIFFILDNLPAHTFCTQMPLNCLSRAPLRFFTKV